MSYSIHYRKTFLDGTLQGITVDESYTVPTERDAIARVFVLRGRGKYTDLTGNTCINSEIGYREMTHV